MLRPRLIACGVALLATSLAGFAQAKDDLVIGVAQFPSSLHPYVDPEVIKSYTLDFTLEPMTAFDKDWKNTCMLCTALPTLQNGMVRFEDRPGGGKGMAVDVKMRTDRLWADGTPVTTADLAFTAKVGHDPSSGFANSRTWTRIDSVEIIDAHTAVLHFNEISTLFDRIPDVLPAHIEGPVYARTAGTGDYGKQSTYNRAPTTPGLYNGPYRMTSYQSGQAIVLEPNARWSGKKPGFKRIILKAIENTAALQANLLAGDIDMAPGDAPSLTIDQVLALRRDQPNRFNYVFRPALTYEHIDFSLDNPVLTDIRVRRAMLHAIDRTTMVGMLFGGMQPVAHSFVNPLDPMHTTDVPHYAYDPAKARTLLAEAGWAPGPDGICRNASGARLSMEFHTTSGNRLRELQQQVLQSQWKQVGVEVTIKNEPARSFFGEVTKKRMFGGLAMYAWSVSVSYPPRQTLGSDQIPTLANNYGGSNYMNFRSSAMDAAILTAETDLDPAHQKAAWAEMQRIYADELPVMPLFFRSEAYVLPKWLKGLTPTGHSDYSSTWSEDWYSE